MSDEKKTAQQQVLSCGTDKQKSEQEGNDFKN